MADVVLRPRLQFTITEPSRPGSPVGKMVQNLVDCLSSAVNDEMSDVCPMDNPATAFRILSKFRQKMLERDQSGSWMQ